MSHLNQQFEDFSKKLWAPEEPTTGGVLGPGTSPRTQRDAGEWCQVGGQGPLAALDWKLGTSCDHRYILFQSK